MSTLLYYATLPEIRRVTEEDRKFLKTVSFDKNELISLKCMKTKDLKGLMMFCDIRTYEGMPVISCTDDEMRLAYLAWRSIHSSAKRAVVHKKLNQAKNNLFKIYDGFMDWNER